MSPGNEKTNALPSERVLSARILFVLGSRVLLANRRGENWYHLPGGNVERGESVEAALHRELREETGSIPRSLDFVGTVEHRYIADEKSWHEVNVVFAAGVPRYADLGSRTYDVDISVVSIHDLMRFQFRPAELGTVIHDWLATRRPRHTAASRDPDPS